MMSPGRLSRITIATIVLLSVAIAVLLVFATVSLVTVERSGVAWSGFTLKYTPGPGDSEYDAYVGQFCPPQGDNPALVVGNVTVSLTWSSANGEPVSNFNVFGVAYPAGTLPGHYVYSVQNSSSGGFSSQSPSIVSSICNYSFTIGAGLTPGGSVTVVIETVYTHKTTAPVL